MKNLTVIIPAYRAENTILKAINSILNSTEPANIIVVEDGVHDNLKSKLHGIENLQLITKLHNEGASSARNTGLDLVETEYVFFLDSDDYVDENIFTSLIRSLDEKNADLGLGPWTFVYDGIPSKHLKVPKNKANSEFLAGWLKNQCFPPCSVMWRTDSIRRIGGWNTSFSNKDDTELMLRALMNNFNIAITNKGCGFYVQHDLGPRLSQAPIHISSEASDKIYHAVSNWKHAQNKIEIQNALVFFCYEQARRSYRSGAKDLGAFWLQRAKNHGLSGHLGSPFHIFLSSLVGLRIKEKLAVHREKISFLKHKYK